MTTPTIENRLWISSHEAARVLGLNEGTLRCWRSRDLRENRGTPERPGVGGLIYRRFNRTVRYYAPSLVQGASNAR